MELQYVENEGLALIRQAIAETKRAGDEDPYAMVLRDYRMEQDTVRVDFKLKIGTAVRIRCGIRFAVDGKDVAFGAFNHVFSVELPSVKYALTTDADKVQGTLGQTTMMCYTWTAALAAARALMQLEETWANVVHNIMVEVER